MRENWWNSYDGNDDISYKEGGGIQWRMLTVYRISLDVEADVNFKHDTQSVFLNDNIVLVERFTKSFLSFAECWLRKQIKVQKHFIFAGLPKDFADYFYYALSPMAFLLSYWLNV